MKGVSMKIKLIKIILFYLLITTNIFAQVVEIPDPNLRGAIREALQLPDNLPVTQQDMLELTKLSASQSSITDLTGLEHAIYLKYLGLCGNQIHNLQPLSGLIRLEHLALCLNQIEDISPLAKLTRLRNLDFGVNRISDISPLTKLIKLEKLNLDLNQVKNIVPLANLTQLVQLKLRDNRIVDFSPLANLVNLRELLIEKNLGTDFTPLLGLNLTEFRYDEICNIPPPLPSVQTRIENRTFPSIFQAWNDVIGLDHLTKEQRNVLHDLHFSPLFETIDWDDTLTEPARGVATQLGGPLAHARQVRQRRLDQNPNMIFFKSFAIHERDSDADFPPDSDLWLRDANGQIVRKKNGEPMGDLLKPEVQALIVNRILGIERCGLYDGVLLDGFAHNGTGFGGRHLFPATDEEIIRAYLNIFRAVRAQAREDFLILVNGGHMPPTRYTEFINGTFMEILKDYPGGYSRALLIQLENTLSWAEENLRNPRINCLEGDGMSIEPPDGPNNLRWMRVFTTMSLTHSDGYVLYNVGYRDLPGRKGDHVHLWHSFWDADLGRPVGTKAQQHHNIDGLFIREFTNGWAVYNRSRKPQTITLPVSTSPVSNRGNATASFTHQLPDLDGEIYLKTKHPADVNGDGVVNILDLVQVSNSFGKSSPDLNDDGVVNILDLVFVAQQFN